MQSLEAYRAQLAAQEAQALNRLIGNYGRSYQRLEALLNSLLLQIGDNPPTKAQLVKLTRYKALMEQVAQELAGLANLTGNEMQIAGEFGLSLGSSSITDFMTIATLGESNPAIAAGFNQLPKAAIEILLGFLDPAGPLYARLRLMVPYVTQAVADAIVEGVTLGYNPRKIAALLRRAFGRGLADALRFVRTVQLWAYREANRATMIANSQLLDGWVWVAGLDSDRTCMACIALHGTIHPVTETLNDHHNGRCVPAPLVKGYGNPVDETGEEWFARQSEATQRKMMGPGKYEAWKEGKFNLADMVGQHDDDVYGLMRIEKALQDLVGADD